MKISLDEKIHLAQIWLTRQEQADEALKPQLSAMYRSYSQQGYLVAVFRSGSQDLYQQTTDLLKYNRRRTAQREVEQEKRELGR